MKCRTRVSAARPDPLDDVLANHAGYGYLEPIAEQDSASNRILSRPQGARQCFVDQKYKRRALDVGLLYVAASRNWDSHRGEVARPNRTRIALELDCTIVSFRAHTADITLECDGDVIREAGRPHSRNPADPPQHVRLHGSDLGQRPCPGRQHSQRQQIRSAEARIDGPKIRERLHEQTGADEQQKGQCDLSADQQRPDSAGLRGGDECPSTLVERVREVQSTQLRERHESEAGRGNNVIATVKASTRQSIATVLNPAMAPGARWAKKSKVVVARRSPAALPATHNSRLSQRNCRIRRPTPAPSAARTATSFARPADRDRSRFARFEHAISSTKTTVRAEPAGIRRPELTK